MITLTTTVMAVATTATRRCRSNFCSSRATRWPNTCRLEPSVTVQVLKKREGKRLSAIDRENSSRSNDNREMYRPKRRPVATRAPVRRRNRVNPALPMTLLLLLRQPLLLLVLIWDATVAALPTPAALSLRRCFYLLQSRTFRGANGDIANAGGRRWLRCCTWSNSSTLLHY